MLRKLVFWLFPVAVAVTPIVALSGNDWWARFSEYVRSKLPAPSSSSPAPLMGVPPPGGPVAAQGNPATDPLAAVPGKAESTTPVSLDEVIRFDISSGW